MTPEEIEEIRERVRSLTERNCVVSPEHARTLLTALEEAEARVEELEGALGWYQEKAEAVVRYGEAGSGAAIEAVFVEIANDGGSRARRALEREER